MIAVSGNKRLARGVIYSPLTYASACDTWERVEASSATDTAVIRFWSHLLSDIKIPLLQHHRRHTAPSGGSPVSRGHLLEHRLVQGQIGNDALEPGVLPLQFLEPLGLR